MSEGDSIEAASWRLAQALDALEAAAEQRRELDREHETRAAQVEAFGSDRARLASELDRTTARARGLENTSREVSQRIAEAIETIRGVLGNDALSTG